MCRAHGADVTVVVTAMYVAFMTAFLGPCAQARPGCLFVEVRGQSLHLPNLVHATFTRSIRVSRQAHVKTTTNNNYNNNNINNNNNNNPPGRPPCRGGFAEYPFCPTLVRSGML